MNVLWLKVGGLWPLNTGGRLRSFHILAEMSKRHRVTLLTTHGPADDPRGLAAALPDTRVVSFPHDIPKQGTPRFALALARSWASPMPVDLFRCRVPALAAEVAGMLARREVDLCVADFLAAMPNVPARPPVPVVQFSHNVEHAIWKRLAGVQARPWARALLEIEWRKMRRQEAAACRRVDLTVTVSRVDREQLAALAPGARFADIATGVDVDYFRPDSTQETPGTLVFTGSMDWYPNEDGVLHFIEAVLPIVRHSVPDVTFTVVGRNPSVRLREAAAAAGVAVTGTVPDVRPHVARGAVYVVPLRVGGGTRLKIFEALAMGRAVVSTRVGAEGLPLVPGRHFLEADEPEAFASAVVGLLRDPARRAALGAAGRELVEARYGWAPIARDFETRCQESIGCESASSVSATLAA
jgi:glycosyltransferase involved in cell wall biosynthesis